MPLPRIAPIAAHPHWNLGREIIQGDSGRLFEPQVVDVFLSIPAEVWSGIHHRNTVPRNATPDDAPQTENQIVDSAP